MHRQHQFLVTCLPCGGTFCSESLACGMCVLLESCFSCLRNASIARYNFSIVCGIMLSLVGCFHCVLSVSSACGTLLLLACTIERPVRLGVREGRALPWRLLWRFETYGRFETFTSAHLQHTISMFLNDRGLSIRFDALAPCIVACVSLFASSQGQNGVGGQVPPGKEAWDGLVRPSLPCTLQEDQGMQSCQGH